MAYALPRLCSVDALLKRVLGCVRVRRFPQRLKHKCGEAPGIMSCVLSELHRIIILKNCAAGGFHQACALPHPLPPPPRAALVFPYTCRAMLPDRHGALLAGRRVCASPGLPGASA